jgi:hypothetical protein
MDLQQHVSKISPDQKQAETSELIAATFAVTDTEVPVATPCHGWKAKLRVHDLRLTGEVVVRCGQCGCGGMPARTCGPS